MRTARRSELANTLLADAVPLPRLAGGWRPTPDKPGAIRECLLAVFPAIPYCIDLIGGPRLETNAAVVTAFRPKGV